MNKLLLALLVLLSACASACTDDSPPAAPLVVLSGDVTSNTLMGARTAWTDLGFIFTTTDDPTIDDCPRRWYDEVPRRTNCAIRITIAKDDNQQRDFGTIGQSSLSQRIIRIDTLVYYGRIGKVPDTLRMVSAHEIGHVIFEADHHKGTKIGVMGGSETPDATPDDFDMACRQVDLCIDGRTRLDYDGLLPYPWPVTGEQGPWI